MLTKDQKIRYPAEELLSVAEHGKMFCLSGGNRTIAERAGMFDEARTRIDRTVSRHEAPLYHVYVGGRIHKQ